MPAAYDIATTILFPASIVGIALLVRHWIRTRPASGARKGDNHEN